MKILIVDDSQDKIREIMMALLEVDGIKENMIEYSRETNDALQKTKDSEYDLLILDLNMPETILDENDENAGASFVDELLGVFTYNKPLDIVVLSAYDRFEDKFIENKTHQGFKLLRYDETSIEWKNKLKAVAKYRLLYAEQKKNQDPIDYAIITAVPVETEAVKRIGYNWKKVKFEDDNLAYYTGEIMEGDLKKKL
jgi:CheY-like chemotaxis protein